MDSSQFVLEDDTQLVRNDKFFTAEIDDELVMMDESQGYYFALNPIGKTIWQILNQPTTYQSLLQQILAEYDVEPLQCQQDVQPFLQELLKNKLIHLV